MRVDESITALFPTDLKFSNKDARQFLSTINGIDGSTFPTVQVQYPPSSGQQKVEIAIVCNHPEVFTSTKGLLQGRSLKVPYFKEIWNCEFQLNKTMLDPPEIIRIALYGTATCGIKIHKALGPNIFYDSVFDHLVQKKAIPEEILPTTNEAGVLALTDAKGKAPISYHSFEEETEVDEIADNAVYGHGEWTMRVVLNTQYTITTEDLLEFDPVKSTPDKRRYVMSFDGVNISATVHRHKDRVVQNGSDIATTQAAWDGTPSHFLHIVNQQKSEGKRRRCTERLGMILVSFDSILNVPASKPERVLEIHQEIHCSMRGLLRSIGINADLPTIWF